VDPNRGTQTMSPTSDPGQTHKAFNVAIIFMISLALVGSLAHFVIQRQGNLAWDDADYLRRGLRLARISSTGSLRDLPYAIGQTLREKPKPPFLVAWVEAISHLVGRQRVVALIVGSSVAPYALLVLGVALVSRRLFGSAAIAPAILCLAASPMSLAFGAKVMVETFLSLWILLIYSFASLFLECPSPRRGWALGAALGLGMMTKLTVVLFLPVTAPLVIYWYLRRYRLDRDTAKVVLRVIAPAAIIAGPWYLKNGRSAIQFARFSSRYNIEALARVEITPTLDRLFAVMDQLPGWSLFWVFLTILVGSIAFRKRDAVARRATRGASADFIKLAVSGAVVALIMLLVPPYFDPRFLLPIWPALAVCCGALIGRLAGKGLPWVAAGYVAMAACLVPSFGRLAAEGSNTTYWRTSDLIDELVTKYGVKTIGNVGDCSNWNVCKTGLVNELRRTPGDCFVLHDLSRDSASELASRIQKVDALVVLDRKSLPANFLDEAPGLNRAYGAIDVVLSGSHQFQSVPTDGSGLPALSVYVRKNVKRASAYPPARSMTPVD
jgi:hypothetical protein